jgi:phosphopantothenoylcysteine decarboxylase/phosphopantothenate--cysteine ligase
MTDHASHMVSVEEIKTAGASLVLSSLYSEDFDYKKVIKEKSVDHIDFADDTDVFVVAPATANIIAKLAHGMADDVLTTTALAVTSPVILSPSMNVNMWNNPAVQENISILKSRGFIIIEPDEGPLACGYIGNGRLPDLKIIEAEIIHQLNRTSLLKGRRVLITSGGTSEPIDDVRSITNKSSGRMGSAVAEAAYRAGAQVTLLSSVTGILPRYQMPTETFSTAKELEAHIEKYLPETDIIFHVAAVADFTVSKNDGKLTSEASHTLHLQPHAKILSRIKTINPSVQLIAFKAEHGLKEEELVAKAQKRLVESSADAIVANDVSKKNQGFQSITNEVIVVTKDKPPYKIPLASKMRVAEALLEYLF